MLAASAAMLGGMPSAALGSDDLIATCLVAWAENVALSGVLSLPSALTRWSLLAGLAVVALASLVGAGARHPHSSTARRRVRAARGVGDGHDARRGIAADAAGWG